MTDKLPTIQIKGKDYVMVKDRIVAFNDLFPNGSITTELVSPVESKVVVVKAIVTPDVEYPSRVFSDYSQAVIGQGMINQTSALENASTSAVGRALAYMGIGVIESVSSADEMNKATNYSKEDNGSTQNQYQQKATYDPNKKITEAQIKLISLLLKKKGQSDEALKSKYKVESKNDLTASQASTIIDNLNNLPDVSESYSEGY